ncbi:MAG TPA: SIR2 family protein [bacterium]|nr:SIR2 family protein [bacterium]
MSDIFDDPDLIRCIANEGGLLFLGAGFSQAAGLPGTRDLCDLLLKKIANEARKNKKDPPRIGEYDLAGAADHYDHFCGPGAAKHDVAQYLKQKTKSADSSLALSLVDLPISVIVTTNYDELIETAFGDKIEVWSRDDHVGQRQRRSLLIKMHGSAIDEKAMILNRDDYDNYQRQRPKMSTVIESELLQSRVVIVGCGLQDGNMRRIIKGLRDDRKWQAPITCVMLDEDSTLENEWRSYGFCFVHCDAGEYLRELVQKVDEYSRQEHEVLHPREVPSDIPPQEDHNPFRFFQADKISPEDIDKVRKYFIDTPNYAKVCSEASNTLIEGHRGSGKTMLLRHLSLEVQLAEKREKSERPRFCGFYIKCGIKYFSSQLCLGSGDTKDRAWVDYFTHVFNLLLALRVTQTLRLVSDLDLLDIDRNREMVFCQELLGDLLRITSLRGNEKTCFKSADRAIEAEFNDARASLDRITSCLPLDFPYQLVNRLRDLHTLFGNAQIFFLLDEMEHLTDAQSRVVNCFLRARDAPITYKVASTYERWPKRDVNDELLRLGHDYTLVITDKYSRNDKQRYFNFLRRVADKCLQQSRCGVETVDELLEERKRTSNEEKIRLAGRDFSGWRRYPYLCSGIVRTFVSLLKDTVSAAYPDIANKAVRIRPISFQIQRSVVSRKSAIHRLGYLDTKDPLQVLRFIDALSRMFREEFEHSARQELENLAEQKGFSRDNIRTVSQFHISDPGDLSPKIKTIINYCVEVGLLQTPLGARQPQQRRHIPHDGYKLHRMLTPYYQLSYANRHPRTLGAGLLNRIFELSESEFVKSALSRQRRPENDQYSLFQETATEAKPDELPGLDYGEDDDF